MLLLAFDLVGKMKLFRHSGQLGVAGGSSPKVPRPQFAVLRDFGCCATICTQLEASHLLND